MPPVDFFPLRKGEKVEFVQGTASPVLCKICKLYDDGDVLIESVEDDEFVRTVPITDLRKLTTADGTLRRQDFISPASQQDIDFNANVKARIKARQDQFEGVYSGSIRRPLYKHQRAGCLLADKYNKFAFFYDTGTGKTVMALSVIEKKHRQEGARFLIIAPKSIIKTAWLDDAANFFPDMRILPLYKGFHNAKKQALLRTWKTGHSRSTAENDKVFLAHVRFLRDILDLEVVDEPSIQNVEEELKATAQHYIINSELFIQNPQKYIDELGVNGIVMDESAIIKNYNSVTSRTMREVCTSMKYVYLLSGKPAPNNEMEFFSQMKIVAPEVFNFSYEKFLRYFCVSNGFRHMLCRQNRELFAEMVSAKSLIISKKDCLDLPETVDVVRLIDLPPSVMDDYDELYQECMVIIKGMDESTLFYSTQSRMAVLMKLRQMASGFFMKRTENGDEEQIIVDIHKAKLNEVLLIIDEIPDQQVIIWCQFQHEIELLEEVLSKRGVTVTAYGKTKQLEENIDAFKKGRARFIIAHPKTLKYGVTFTNCKYAIYYSFSYSAEDYDQSHDRNYRLGQTESCTYFYIQAADTIDEIMYMKVIDKLTNAEFFEHLVKDAAKHGIDYSSLKSVSDQEIQQELSSDNQSSTIHSLQDKIVRHSEERESVSNVEEAPENNVDYLDAIAEPTAYELVAVEKLFQKELEQYLTMNVSPPLYERKEEYVWGEEQDEIITISKARVHIPSRLSPMFKLDAGLLDFSRIDILEAALNINEDEEPVLTKADDDSEFLQFIQAHPVHEQWVVDMYRMVHRVLREFPIHLQDMLIMKYGLHDGIKRTNITISNAIGTYYYLDKRYKCYPSKVSLMIEGAIEDIRELKWAYPFEKFTDYLNMLNK